MKKVDNSCFSTYKSRFITLIDTLEQSYHHVSILVQKSVGKNYRYSKSGTIIKDNMFSDAGATIRFWHENNIYEYSFNDYSDTYIKTLPCIISDYVNMKSKMLSSIDSKHNKNSADSYKFADFSSNSIDSKLTESSETTCNPSLTDYKFNKSTEYEIHPDDIPDHEIISKLTALHDKALSHHEQIIDCVCVFQYLETHKLFLSKSKDMEQHILWSNGLIQPLAKRGDKTRYYLETYSHVGGAELINQMDTDISRPCRCVIELLDSIPPTPGFYDVVCMPDVTGLIAHEAFGHGVEMDMFVKDRALAEKYLNKEVASTIVNMHDNAATCSQCGSYFFDDEGTLSHDTLIIENGILKSGINDLLTANRLNNKYSTRNTVTNNILNPKKNVTNDILNTENTAAVNITPTGNGRRESYEHKAYTRMTNTYFEAGNSTIEEMISSIEYGLLLENAASGMEDPKNWGIQCMVNIGREIKNGKLTGRIFSPICLSGYVPDLLKSISMISNEKQLFGSGYCGKGYKEWVKVSDGGPAIKARVKIS